MQILGKGSEHGWIQPNSQMPEQKITDFRIREAIRQIESNFAEDIDFNRLAEILNLSIPHLRKLFKQQTGLSFRKYLRRVRMYRARHLLETPFLKIRQIAEKVGIRDSSCFVREFEKQFGASPRKYRRDYHSANEKSV